MGSYILQIVVLLLVVINILYWRYSGIKSVWEKLLGIPFITVAAGTPIIFTSLTRSVFEVSKLLNLRLAIVWIATIVLLRAIVTKEKIKFIKTPLNWALLAYAAVNIISTLLSPNKYIAILGAYDRWEGLITEFNYILFVFFYLNFVKEKKTFFWLIGVLLVGSVSSAIYGVFQAMGIDFMHWSVNPESRVFACINNPVHYSPYIIMHIPLLAGFVYYLVKQFNITDLKLKAYKKGEALLSFIKENKVNLVIYLILFSLLILHYSGNYLSFGRAAWIGFALSISYFLCLLFELDMKNLIHDVVFIGLGNLLFNGFYVFKIYLASPKSLIALILVSVIYVAMMFLKKEALRKYILFTLIVIFAGLIQFTAVSLPIILLELLIIYGINKYHTSEFDKTDKFLKNWLFLMLILVVIIPSYKNIYASFNIQYNLLKDKTKTVNSIQKSKSVLQESSKLMQQGVIDKSGGNIFMRTQTYSVAYTEGTARTSMWKSGLVWWLDGWRNFLVGTGPCTVKEMYPKYRRTDYGRLEGGHNFTPDKLHNDYINMLATRGLLGFVTYYLWLLPLGMLMILNKLRTEGYRPGNYLLIGLFAGMFVYLGQVMFNFGVVATRIIFYEYFCLALVMVLHDPFKSADKNK